MSNFRESLFLTDIFEPIQNQGSLYQLSNTEAPRIKQESTPTSESIPLFAEEVRQFIYCPRVLYWRRVVGISGTSTTLMAVGTKYHQQRNRYTYLRSDDLTIQRNKYFWDSSLALGARIDLLRELEDVFYVVEFKRYFHGLVFQSHIFQAIVSGLVAETQLPQRFAGIEVQYYQGRRQQIAIDQQLRKAALDIVAAAKQMIQLQIIPETTEQENKCKVCEFRRICNP